MKQEFLNKIKLQLLEDRSKILNLPSKKIDLDTDGDEVDEIQCKLILETETHLSSLIKNKLFQIEDALKKIEIGSYGICEDCEELIAELRLEKNPHFTTCVCCAEDREKEILLSKQFK